MALDVRDDRVPQVGSAGAPGALRVRYLPIAEHGLIGDLHTVALVGSDGTIDWYCCPRFDSPSFFAAILNADRGALCLARLRRLELQAALPPRYERSHHAPGAWGRCRTSLRWRVLDSQPAPLGRESRRSVE